MPIIEVKNLTKEFWYSAGIFLPVISDVSFIIEEGETVGLLGRTGSGKSTLGLMLTRLLDTTSGEIYFRNERIDNIAQKDFKKFRKKIQIVFQDSSSSLNPVYNILEQLKELYLFHKICESKEVKKHVGNSLAEVGLAEEIMLKYPHQLSAGEKQRVCIARSLIPSPDFIVLDEITSSLDVINERKIIDLLSEIKIKRSISYLFITHDIKLAQFFCQRLLLMDSGKVSELNDKSEAEKKLTESRNI